MEDHELVEKLKGGDAEAFRLVIEKYQALVLNCSFKFLRNRESAEDLTQEVFIEVFESIRSFRSDAQLSTWIYRIAVTKSLNHLKSFKRKKRFAIVVSLFGEERIEERIASSKSASPDSQLENQERVGLLTWALDSLPANQRVAFTLSKIQGMSYEEISLMMDISIPSVESLIHRAKTNLRKKLHKYYQQHLQQ
jgi:RNA polymerase sigma-70 factor, ECF subfamily